jgi:large subunit ribosomal protein L3
MASNYEGNGMKAILGKKVGMTQVFTADGKMTAVTAILATPNVVVGHRTPEKDGYSAVILGFDSRKEISKPLTGQLKKNNIDEKIAVLKEFRTEEALPEIASTLTVSTFEAGEIVDVSGTSKGKGYSGVIKRHNFHRGPQTHGSDHHRKPGSIGSAFPQRVVKGRKMPGHMGSDTVTIKKLQIIEVHPDKNILLVKGAIPGSNGTVVEIRGYENA